MKEDLKEQIKEAIRPFEEAAAKNPPELSATEIKQLSNVFAYLRENYFKEKEN